MDDSATPAHAARGFYSFMEQLSALRGGGGVAVGPHEPQAGAGGGEAAARLESTGNNSEFSSEGRTVIAPCKCGIRTCGECGPRLGWRVRQQLLAQADQWRSPALFTQTVDRDRFSDPEEAYRLARPKVTELLRLLGVRRYVVVLEFQMKSESKGHRGWPHWHSLVDLADCPQPGRMDLARAWRLWRDKWGMGGLDLSKKETASVTHAVMYATKYLMKFPAEGFPAWVMKSSGVKFVQPSQLVGPLVARTKRAASGGGRERGEYAERRSMISRVAECGSSSRLFRVRLDPATGEERSTFCGSLPCSADQLIELSAAGAISAKVERDADGAVVFSGSVDAVRDEVRALSSVGETLSSRADFVRLLHGLSC